MPQVPKVQPGSVTALSRVGDTGQVGRALQGAGGQIQQLGGQVTAFAQAREQAKKVLLTKQLQFKHGDAFTKAFIDLKNNPNYNEYEKISTDFMEAQGKIFDEDTLHLPKEQREALKLNFDSQAAAYKNRVGVREIEQMGIATKAVIEREYNESLVKYANAPTQEIANSIQATQFAEWDLHVQPGTIRADEVERLKQSYIDVAEDARVEKAIQDNPVLAEEMIKSGEFDLDPKEKQTAINRANAIQKQRVAQAKAAQGQAEQSRDRAEKKVHDEQVDEIGDLYANFKFTEALEKLQGSELIKGTEKRAWTNALQSQLAVKVDETKDPFDTHDPQVYGNMAKKISLDPESIESTAEIWALHGRGLTTKNAQDLEADWVAWRDGQNKPVNNANLSPELAAVNTRNKTALTTAYSNGLFGEPGTKNADKLYGAAGFTWDQFINANRDTDKPATAKEAQTFFDDIIRPEVIRGWYSGKVKEVTSPTLQTLEGVDRAVIEQGQEKIVGKKDDIKAVVVAKDEESGKVSGAVITPNRRKAIAELQKAGLPVTEGNIKVMIGKLKEAE